MTKGIRVLLFIFTFILLSVIIYNWKGLIFPVDTVGLVIYSSLLMLSFVSLFIEHYFTRPTDVLSSTIAILLLITPLKSTLIKFGIWYEIFFYYNLILAFVSITSILLFNSSLSKDTKTIKISDKLKNIAIHFGSGKFLFFILFILSLLFYVDSNSQYFIFLFAFSVIILLVQPHKFIMKFRLENHSKHNDIGKIFGVQSKKTFLVKLYEERIPVRLFDFVEFRYSMDEDKKVFRGLVLDNYLLNQEQWIKVLVNEEINKIFSDKVYNEIEEDNTVYKINNPEHNDYLQRLVGAITENSTISKIRFIYNSKVKISEGQLLEVTFSQTKVLYQVVQGLTQIEPLEQKNETGYIVGEAIQLGIWIPEKKNFEKFGEQNINWELMDQEFIDEGNRQYDILRIKFLSGETKEFYFDITDFYGKE